MAQGQISSTLSATSTIPAQLYAALISSSDDAIILKSLDGVILTWNQGAMRIWVHAGRGDRPADDAAVPSRSSRRDHGHPG
jgi:hypothetical protein